MRDRALVHVARPAGSGKTTFIERLLDADVAFAICVRGVGEPLLMMALERPGVVDDLRRSFSGKLAELRRSPPPAPTEHWAIEEGYEGIELAQLVIVNVRTAEERDAATKLIGDLGRIRKDDSIYREIVGLRGNKVPITAVIADLTDGKGPGLKKAIARVKRATKRREW